MKTIKELEAEGLYPRHMIEESSEKGFINAVKHIKIEALKDVLELIEEMDDEDNWEFKCPVCGDDVLEELKKRITG